MCFFFFHPVDHNDFDSNNLTLARSSKSTSKPKRYSGSSRNVGAIRREKSKCSGKKENSGNQSNKKKRFVWAQSDMQDAQLAVINGTSIRKASQQFNVPRSTLHKIACRKTEIGAKPGKKPLLGQCLETKLVDFASNRAALGIGFGKRQFFNYAAQLAKKHRLTFKKGNLQKTGGD